MKKANLYFLTALVLAVLTIFSACASIREPAPETAAPTEAPVMTRSVVESFTSELLLGGNSITIKSDYVYNELGLIREMIAWTNGEETSRSTFENDEMGEVIRETAVSNGVTTVTESENTYGPDGNLIKKVDTVTEDGSITYIREYNYNADHQHTQVTFITQGENPVTSTTRYVYDIHGNQTEEHQETNGITTSIFTEYIYDGQDRIIKAMKHNGDGTLISYTEYTYSNDGSQTVRGYLPDGTLSSTIHHTYNEENQLICREVWQSEVLTQRTTYSYITVPAFK